MKKYGIITFYKTYNYGSALQGYALLRTLEKLGVDAELIDYSSENVSELKRIANKEIFFKTYKYLIWKKERSKKIERFQQFYDNYLKESKRVVGKKEIREIAKDYEGFISGSDQIWTPTPYGYDYTYLLDFADDNQKKVAYAPSIGYKDIISYYKLPMKKLMDKYDYLSVREKHGAKIVEELTCRDVKVVLDPTLLITKEEWIEFSNDLNITKPYIFCYFLGNRKFVREFTLELKKKTNCQIVICPVVDMDFTFGDKKVGAGPREFVSLINNAEYVCTDSFHAVLFSINLNKKFFALKRHNDNDKENQNLRITNILEELSLEDRYIEDDNSFMSLEEIDYTKPNKKLESLRKESIKYLEDCFKERNKDE